MDCDICGCSEPNGTVVSAANIREAATMGYNPYLVGFPQGSPMELMAKSSSSPASDIANWKQRTLDGALSTSDWNMCSKCVAKFNSFLSMAERVPGAAPDAPMSNASAFSVPMPSVATPVPQALPTPSVTLPQPSAVLRPAPQAIPPPPVPPEALPKGPLPTYSPSPVSTPLPAPVPAPIPITALRTAITRTVKGVLVIVGILIIKNVVFSFLKTYSSYQFSIKDWISLLVAIFVSGYGARLLKSIYAIFSYSLTSNVNLGRLPEWCRHHLENLTAAIKYLILLLFVGFLYLVLMPNVSQFNHLILKTDVITTVLNILFIVAAVVVVFLIGKHLYPLVDLLAQRVTDRVVPLPDPTASYAPAGCGVSQQGTCVNCPNCQGINEVTSLFCAYCGYSLLAQPNTTTPPASGKKCCPGCSTPNDLSSKFCYNCGTPL